MDLLVERNARVKPSAPRDRSEPAPFDIAQGVVSEVETTERRARARVGESEGRSPSDKEWT